VNSLRHAGLAALVALAACAACAAPPTPALLPAPAPKPLQALRGGYPRGVIRRDGTTKVKVSVVVDTAGADSR